MSPLNRYTTLFWAKNIPPTARPTQISDKYSHTIINWTKVYSLPFVLHETPNWENFNTKFWTTLSLQMIKYFASAFHNLQIALFAIKNQNQNIHTIPAIASSSCDSVRKDPFRTFSDFRWTFTSFWPLPNGAHCTFAGFWELTRSTWASNIQRVFTGGHGFDRRLGF